MGKQLLLSITEKWFDAYYVSLLAFGTGQCQNMALVEDSINDVFEKIYRMEENEIQKLESIEKPLSYLRVSLKNTITDNLRKESRILDIEEVKEEPVVSISESEKYCNDKKEELTMIVNFFEALGILPNPMRDILALKAEGYSGREIEELLHLSKGYSDTLFSRFKSKVNKYRNK